MNRIECEDLVAWIVQLSPRSIPDGQLATEDAVDKLVDVWLEALGDFTLVEAKRAALKHQNTSQYPVSAGDIRYHAIHARRSRPDVAWMYGEV
jgi:hypothetical protein